jgi:ASC-1-like (ASCH) protein
MMDVIGIDSKLIDDIRRHKKYIEVRLGKPRFLKIKEGDVLGIREDLYLNGNIVDSFNDSLRIKITQVLYFETFDEMLDLIDFKAAIPSAKSTNQAKNKYREFYSEDEEDKYGVVAMFFEPIE